MLSDEEFLVLRENYQSKNPDFPWDSYDPFTLVNMDEAECKAEFRVEKNDLQRLAEALKEHWNATKEPYAMEWRDCACCWNDWHTHVVSVIWFRVLEDLFLSYVW